MATPHHPQNPHTAASTLLVGARISIAAPPSHVYACHTDLSRYPEWNSFCRSASSSTTPLAEGSSLTLRAKMSAYAPALPIFLRVVKVVRDDGGRYMIAWDAAGAPGVVLASHRETEVLPVEGGCEVTTWECMSGGASYAVRALLLGTLQGKFEGWCNELKEFAERTWREEHGGK